MRGLLLVATCSTLFATALAKADLQRFDENRFRSLYGGAANGCFTLDALGETSSYAGLAKIGLTSWSREDGHYRFSLYHSPDAGYEVTVKPTQLGLVGTGASWGGGSRCTRLAQHGDCSCAAHRGRRHLPLHISDCERA